VHVRKHVGRTLERTRTTLCATVAGRRIVLRRAELVDPRQKRPSGVLIGGAAAAGRRVAWIETRFALGRRVAIVRVVRIGGHGRVHPVRRIGVRLERSSIVPDLDVAITRRGELAWITAPFPGRFERIVYDPPHGRPRIVAYDPANRLAVEDGITLRWSNGQYVGFFDLPRPATGACPRRTGFRAVASNDTIAVTQRTYFDGYLLVLRACMLATGRDVDIAQAEVGLGGDELLDIAGLDRQWVVLSRGRVLRTGESCELTQETIDARPGGIPRETRTHPCQGEPPLASAGEPLAVTSRGIPAWVAGEQLLTGGPDGSVAEVDRGAIENLRASGTAVEWTRDGVPRSVELE
jgi:hypothetical protein